jgi:hypothetical protein
VFVFEVILKVLFAAPPKNDSKRIAYLIDMQTVQVLDLTNNTVIATVAHDSKVIALFTLFLIIVLDRLVGTKPSWKQTFIP